MKKSIIILIVIAVALLAGYIVLNLINKPVASLRDIPPEVELTSEGLMKAYAEDEVMADALYLGKVMRVSGILTEITSSEDGIYTLYIETGDPSGSICCELEPAESARAAVLQPGKLLTVKGRCTGYLMDVILNQCIIEN